MSVSSEFLRIQADRNTIRTKLVELGLVGDTANLDDCATAVDSIANNGEVIATFDGLTATRYTIPAGYHSGSGAVSLTNDIEAALAAI